MDRPSSRYKKLVEELGREMEHRYGWQSEVARRLGMHNTVVGRVLAGTRKKVSAGAIQRAALGIGISEAYFSDPEEPASYHDYENPLMGFYRSKSERELADVLALAQQLLGTYVARGKLPARAMELAAAVIDLDFVKHAHGSISGAPATRPQHALEMVQALGSMSFVIEALQRAAAFEQTIEEEGERLGAELAKQSVANRLSFCQVPSRWPSCQQRGGRMGHSSGSHEGERRRRPQHRVDVLRAPATVRPDRQSATQAVVQDGVTLGTTVEAAPRRSRDDQRVSLGRTLATFDEHAAALGEVVVRRERELAACVSPGAKARAAERLVRARARWTTALDDAKRHAAPTRHERAMALNAAERVASINQAVAAERVLDGSPLTLADASVLAAEFTRQCRMAAGNTGNRATARVLTAEDGVDAHKRSAYLEFNGATTPHRLTLTCTSRERALAHWDGYTVAPVVAAPAAPEAHT